MFCLLAPLSRAAINVQVSLSLPSPQPLGTLIALTLSATDSGPGPVNYRFEIAPPGSPTFQMTRDFSLTNTLNWFPWAAAGTYQVRVTARDNISGESDQQVVPFVLSPRQAGALTVASTDHPLVALLSAPGCVRGAIRAFYSKQGSTARTYTTFQPCPASGANFLLAGLAPNSQYVMGYQTKVGSTITNGPYTVDFRSGAIPASVPLPTVNVLNNPAAGVTEKINLMSFPYPYTPAATDLLGNPLWYYPDLAAHAQLTRPLPGGTILMLASGPGTGTGAFGPGLTRQQLLREVDLAGNIVHEICADRASEMLVALGRPPISRFNHDVLRLSNGYTMVLADAQKAYPAGTQGASHPIDVVGAMIFVLDTNWSIVWTWNAFDHAGGGGQLDINRAAVRGEVCAYNSSGLTPIGCPQTLLPGFQSAKDWLHANSLNVMADGGLLVSLRNQDWLIKIDYANGAGTGNILWLMGVGGNFTFTGSSDPYPWFSGQHDAAFEFGGATCLSLFDDGNTRVRRQGGDSRGQVLIVDQDNLTVSSLLNVGLGVYASSEGSAQPLSNGDWSFMAGSVTVGSGVYSRQIEVNPAGGIVYQIQYGSIAYRGWRLSSFYAPPTT